MLLFPSLLIYSRLSIKFLHGGNLAICWGGEDNTKQCGSKMNLDVLNYSNFFGPNLHIFVQFEFFFFLLMCPKKELIGTGYVVVHFEFFFILMCPKKEVIGTRCVVVEFEFFFFLMCPKKEVIGTRCVVVEFEFFFFLMCPKKEVIGMGCVVLAGAISLILNDDADACKQSSVSLLRIQPFVAS